MHTYLHPYASLQATAHWRALHQGTKDRSSENNRNEVRPAYVYMYIHIYICTASEELLEYV